MSTETKRSDVESTAEDGKSDVKSTTKSTTKNNVKKIMDDTKMKYQTELKENKQKEAEKINDHAEELKKWKGRGQTRANELCTMNKSATYCKKDGNLNKRLENLDEDAWEKVKEEAKNNNNSEEVDKFLSKTSHESMIEKETHGHKSPVHNFVKALVAAMGKNSPGAKKGREDLQRLLKIYPNKVPGAIIEIITDKIRAHGLGLIFGIQAASTIAGLLISIIPIPGMGVIGEGFAITGDGFIDAIEVLKPDGIFKMLSSYEEKIFKILEKYGTLISGMLSGIGCCSKDQGDLNKNLDNFGTIVSELIKDVDADKTVDAKGIVKKIQEFMKKTTEEKIDTKKLTKLAEEIKSEKKSSAAPAGAPASLDSPADVTADVPNPQQGANVGGKRRSRRGKRVYNKQTCKKNTRKKNKRNKRTKKRKKRRKTRRKKRKRN